MKKKGKKTNILIAVIYIFLRNNNKHTSSYLKIFSASPFPRNQSLNSSIWHLRLFIFSPKPTFVYVSYAALKLKYSLFLINILCFSISDILLMDLIFWSVFSSFKTHNVNPSFQSNVTASMNLTSHHLLNQKFVLFPQNPYNPLYIPCSKIQESAASCECLPSSNGNNNWWMNEDSMVLWNRHLSWELSNVKPLWINMSLVVYIRELLF